MALGESPKTNCKQCGEEMPFQIVEYRIADLIGELNERFTPKYCPKCLDAFQAEFIPARPPHPALLSGAQTRAVETIFSALRRTQGR